MLIITGTGRSGTGLLARLFNGYHEFRVQYILDKYINKADQHSEPFHSYRERLKVVLDLHQGIDRRTFVDSSNLYIHFIDAVYALNPSAKFILTVRNGKDFVRSAYSRRWHEYKIFGTVPPYNDPYFNQWNRMTPLQKNAWIWVYRNRKALEGLSHVPAHQKLTVKIEDIGQAEILDEIESFTGIKTADRSLTGTPVNQNPVFDFPPAEQWSEAQNAEFYEIARKFMEFFNYI